MQAHTDPLLFRLIYLCWSHPGNDAASKPLSITTWSWSRLHVHLCEAKELHEVTDSSCHLAADLSSVLGYSSKPPEYSKTPDSRALTKKKPMGYF